MKKRGSLFLTLFVIWTVLIQIVDVDAIGPRGTEVGFASLNAWFHRLTGVHMTLYVITDWLGLVPVFICMVFGVIGLVQWIRRKSLWKVDCELRILGIYYILVIFAYLIFEMSPINYRPILIGGFLEASYPSSTTLLVLSVMPTFIEESNRLIQRVYIRRTLHVLAMCFSIFMVLGRVISGVHWLTDIVGSAFLSAGMFGVYRATVLWCHKKEVGLEEKRYGISRKISGVTKK